MRVCGGKPRHICAGGRPRVISLHAHMRQEVRTPRDAARLFDRPNFLAAGMRARLVRGLRAKRPCRTVNSVCGAWGMLFVAEEAALNGKTGGCPLVG